MTFLNEIKKTSSEKFSLVRLELSKFVEVSNIGGNYYQATTSLNVSKCYIGKNKLTQIFTGLPNSNQFTYDENLLTVYSSTAIQNVIIKHYVYLSVGKNRAIGKNPMAPLVDLVEWRGVLTKEPDLDEDLSNINSGVLSVSTSSIELYNHSGEFDFLFSRVDGVYNSTFDVWFFCNNESTYAFSGIIISASQNNKIISLRTANPIEKLNSACSLAYNQNKAYVHETIFPNACPSYVGVEIPIMLGKISDYEIEYSGSPSAKKLKVSSLRQASCVNFDSNITTSTNREWITSRIFNFSFLQDSVSFTGAGPYAFNLTTTDRANWFTEFDRFRIGTSAILEVTGVSSNIVFAKLISGTMPSSPATLRLSMLPVLYLYADETEYRMSPLNYSVTHTMGYDNEISLLNVILDDDIESVIGLSRPIDPNSDELRFRLTSFYNNHYGHFNVAQVLLGYSGISTNVTIPTTQEHVSFMLPFNGESYGSYLETFERLCQSHATYVFQNLDGTYNYNYFSPPTNCELITDDDILSGSYSIEESGQDICSRLIFEKNAKDSVNDIIYNSDDIETLIGGSTEKTIKTVSLSSTIRNEVILQNMFKTSSHSFKSKNLGYDWTIGKSINLYNKELTVIKINKSLDGIEIKAIDTFTE